MLTPCIIKCDESNALTAGAQDRGNEWHYNTYYIFAPKVSLSLSPKGTVSLVLILITCYLPYQSYQDIAVSFFFVQILLEPPLKFTQVSQCFIFVKFFFYLRVKFSINYSPIRRRLLFSWTESHTILLFLPIIQYWIPVRVDGVICLSNFEA